MILQGFVSAGIMEAMEDSYEIMTNTENPIM